MTPLYQIEPSALDALDEAACKLASEMTNGLAFEIIQSDETHAA